MAFCGLGEGIGPCSRRLYPKWLFVKKVTHSQHLLLLCGCQLADATSLVLLDQPAGSWEGSVTVNLTWLVTAVIPVLRWCLGLDPTDVKVGTILWSAAPQKCGEKDVSQYVFVVAGCECDPRGSVSDLCDQLSGQCACHSHVTGRRCDRCQPGFWGFPQCRLCECNNLSEMCDEKGQCQNCRDHSTGQHCDRLHSKKTHLTY